MVPPRCRAPGGAGAAPTPDGASPQAGDRRTLGGRSRRPTGPRENRVEPRPRRRRRARRSSHARAERFGEIPEDLRALRAPRRGSASRSALPSGDRNRRFDKERPGTGRLIVDDAIGARRARRDGPESHTGRRASSPTRCPRGHGATPPSRRTSRSRATCTVAPCCGERGRRGVKQLAVVRPRVRAGVSTVRSTAGGTRRTTSGRALGRRGPVRRATCVRR